MYALLLHFLEKTFGAIFYPKLIGDFASSMIAASISAESIEGVRRGQCDIAIRKLEEFNWPDFPVAGTILSSTSMRNSEIVLGNYDDLYLVIIIIFGLNIYF